MFHWYAKEELEDIYVGKNWRKLNKQMIQTFNKHVWLWDDVQGVAVIAPVPSRPWKNINPDFSHWMSGTEGEAPPGFPPQDAKRIAPEQLNEMVAANTLTSFVGGSFFASLDEEEEDDDLMLWSNDWDDEDEENEYTPIGGMK